MMSIRRLAMINSDGKRPPAVPDGPGVRTDRLDVRIRALARTPFEHLFVELGTVAAAESAIASAYDGIYIDTFGDYGIERIRAIADVPVTGAGEASLRAAAKDLGDYSIVTVWPTSMAYLYEERLASCEGGDSCTAVHYLSDEQELDRVGTQDGVGARMIRSDQPLIEDLVSLCVRAVETDATAGVLLGCTCMSPIAEELAARCNFPVLDPSQIGHAEALDKLLANTVETAAPTSSQAGLASAVVDAYLAARGTSEVSLSECEVCVVTQ